LGGNSGQNGSFNDFYEYDPSTDTWSNIASYGLALGDAMAFTIGQEIYVCGGINFSNGAGSSVLKKYLASSNTWTTLNTMGGGVTMGAVGITCNNRAFVGTGYNSGFNERIDWWEFAASSTLCPAPVSFATNTTATNGTAQCDGKIMISSISNGCAPYTVSVFPSGTITAGSGNTFTISGLCSGNYTVSVSDNNCCGTTKSVSTVPGNLTTGLNAFDLSHNNEYDIFPNPSGGTFNIYLQSGQKPDFEKIMIVDIIGRKVNFKAENSTEINLFEKQPGIYFLKYGNSSTIKKIIVE
jgi:hypothetical protein